MLMVFDDPLVEARFLGVHGPRLRETRVDVPLWVSSRDVLKMHGTPGTSLA